MSFIGYNGQGTNDKQTLTKDGVLRGGLNVMPLPPPPKRQNLSLGLGEGVAEFNLVQKGRAGDAIIMRWRITMMMTMTMVAASGESEERSINDSIS